MLSCSSHTSEAQSLTLSASASPWCPYRLEMESSQMADELDVGRDKGLRLIKAETQIAKYQQRLEEMNGLKKLNKELSERNDQYMDQVHRLESSNRGIDTLRKQVRATARASSPG